MKILNRFADRFARVQPLDEGIYHKQALLPDETPYRVHLRLKADGWGILIVNASTVLQLNPTAAEYAYHFINGTELQEAAEQVAARYRVSKAMALEDYRDFTARIKRLISSPDLDPVSYLDFERLAPHSADLTAPLRLDCALTYRLPVNTQADYAPTRRVERELNTGEWETILDKAWQAGIPHVTFTGGEATLRDDLPALIAHAEANGQVCGLLTDGLKLADAAYLETLLQTGLDHVLVAFQPNVPSAWTAIETIVSADIFLTVHLTLHQDATRDTLPVLAKLFAAGVRNISLSGADAAAGDSLQPLRDKAGEIGFTLRWDLPVPYSESNPVAAETEQDEVPTGAGRAWLYVEPDGDVLPSQGFVGKALGNLLRDPWDKIYR